MANPIKAVVKCEILSGISDTIRFSELFTNNFSTDSTFQINFNIPGVTNPLKTIRTSQFMVTTYYKTNCVTPCIVDDTVENSIATLMMTAGPGTLDISTISVTSTTYVVGVKGATYIIKFKPKNGLFIGGDIKLLLPRFIYGID